MRQQVQGEEVFPDEAQSRDYVWRLYNRKSLMLLMKTTSEDLSNTYKDGKRAVAEAPNWGGATPVIKGDRLWWKAKTPKRVGVGGAVKQKGTEAPNIEIEVEDCEEYTASFSFYVISGSYLSHSPHGGREFWSHFDTSQLKEDVTAYESRRHLREGVRAMKGAQFRTPQSQCDG
jgi:hypothetical protein